MISFEKIEVGKRYLEKVIESGMTESDEETCEVLILAKNETAIYALIDFSYWNKHYPDQIEQLKLLSIEQLYDGNSYDVAPDADDDVVVYDHKDEKILTCLGFEIQIIEEIIN